MSTTPRKKLSTFRLLVAITAVVLAGYFSVNKVKTWQTNKDIEVIDPWFAAYVDVTSVPQYPFEQLGNTDTPHAVLSFIVSATEEACQPSWGTYYNLDQAAEKLDLDRRIARLQQQGGKVAVSFGGALNSELSLNCTDYKSLSEAYEAVIDRYTIDTIDLDLENESLADKEALRRRAKVIASIQKERRENGQNLAVWLTLPVAPQGLTQDGTDAVAAMLKYGVDLAGVNLMTMDYGESKSADDTMLQASVKALRETHRQLGILYSNAGINLSSASLWKKIGATPMIGQNDVVNEVFSIDDAKGLNEYGTSKGIARMSMWSANRDIQCGENYVDVKVVSDSCSGVVAPPQKFAQTLSLNFDGDLTQNAKIVTIEDPQSGDQIVDNPETSPYQIWQESGAYLEGTKVVWHGNVYEAKWWTRGDLPDNPVLQSWETPWLLIGPVLPGEKPVEQATLPQGTYPEWNGTTEYQAGQRVLFEGVPFQAKWWNQGQSPAASASNFDSSPWLALSQQEVKALLEQN